MRNRARKWMNRRTILFQMTIIISLIILPIYAVIAGYSYRTRESYVRQGTENVEHILELYMQVLDDRIVSADEYLIREADDNLYAVQLKNAATEKDAGLSPYFFWQDLYARVRNSVEEDAYFFWQTRIDSSQLASKKNWSALRATLLDEVQEVVREDKTYKWQICELVGEKWLVHILPTTKDFICRSLINLSDIEKQIQEQLSEELAGEVRFQENAESGKNQVSGASKKSGCYLTAEISRKVFLSQTPAQSRLLSFLLLVYVLAVPILLYVVYIKMLLPTRRINEAMRRLEENDRDFRIQEEGENQEATQMIHRFNAMADQLDHLKIQVYEQELEKQEIEAINLRLQVNPHFILNCLNTIFSLTKTGNLENTRRFTKYLANYLRFTLWHTSGMVNLMDEMKGVEDYLEIQKIRYPNAFTYLNYIFEEAENARIPSLLIINFVENVVKHALTLEEEVEIIVVACVVEERLRITVCDTGNGMEPELLEQLQKGEIVENETGKHIGLWNCRRRLDLMYGEDCTFHITSQPGEGTQIFIEIPMEVQDESFDR